MPQRSTKVRRILFLITPILIGVAVFFFFVTNKQELPIKERVDNKRSVRVIELALIDIVPKTKGFGTVKPTNVWQAVAEVSGKAVYVSPLLKKGQRVANGTLLLEIDPTEYKLTVAEAEANLRSIAAQNTQLNDKATSNQELLKLELHTLELKQKELDRQQTLASTNITTKSDYEQAETAFIAQKYKVQALQNALNSLVSEHELLKAQKEQAALKLQSALLQLKYTKIIAPFDCLISAVNAEHSQFIQKGQTVAEADNIDSVEIEAQLANGLYVFRPLENENLREKIIQDNVKLGDVFGISAIVRSVSGKNRSEWKGEVMRFNVEIDTKTRTPGIIVQVNDPFSLNTDQPGRPLIKGMYCEVELFGRPFRDQIIIPRTALHGENTVYVVDENNTIHFRTVETGFSQDSFTMIHSGLSKGEKVVLTDLVPAVEGMAVIPVIDQETAEKINTEARGGNR